MGEMFMKKLSDAADLTTGSPAKVIAMYTFPMLGSMFFQQAYNLADSWIAGNFVGADCFGGCGHLLSCDRVLYCHCFGFEYGNFYFLFPKFRRT